jgi:hypothetical protein
MQYEAKRPREGDVRAIAILLKCTRSSAGWQNWWLFALAAEVGVRIADNRQRDR